MKKWFALALLASAFSCVAGAAWAQAQPRPQPGSTQEGTTTVFDSAPKFNPDYFIGDWKFEGLMSESPLGEGGTISGTEIVRSIWDGRFWDVTIKGEGADGAPFSGRGVLLYQDSFSGQSFTRHEFTRGVALLRTGPIGCDLGGTCTAHYETPPFEVNGSVVQLRGRYYLTGLFSYQVLTEISVDKSEYRNLGTVRYQKDPQAPKPHAIK